MIVSDDISTTSGRDRRKLKVFLARLKYARRERRPFGCRAISPCRNRQCVRPAGHEGNHLAAYEEWTNHGGYTDDTYEPR